MSEHRELSDHELDEVVGGATIIVKNDRGEVWEYNCSAKLADDDFEFWVKKNQSCGYGPENMSCWKCYNFSSRRVS